ncbi:MAG: HD domain-containing protein [Oscillospiraceae bacterium]|jgi:3'-5' exoribonuclease|nr:HD domain-containing protein [Oscillospiraceae bacterium]
MPIPLVESFVKDTRYDGFLLVRAAAQRAAANGSRYLDMTLGDRTGEINAKLWDGAFAPPIPGTVLRVRGQLLEYNGRLQLRVERMRPASDEDDVQIDALVQCAPEPPERMLAEVRKAAEGIARTDLRALIGRLLDEAGDALATFPGAAKLHHAERGGLLHHTTAMLRMAFHYADEYPSLDRDLLIAGVIAHDLAKIGEMDADELGTVSEYTPDGMLIGHLVRGVARVDQAGKELGVNAEILLMLEHMLLSHHGLPEYGSPKPPMFPEAEVLHHLDTLDARIYEMNAALARVRPGGFSERLWSLDRKLYRRTDENAPAEKEKP